MLEKISCLNLRQIITFRTHKDFLECYSHVTSSITEPWTLVQTYYLEEKDRAWHKTRQYPLKTLSSSRCHHGKKETGRVGGEDTGRRASVKWLINH